MTEGQCHCGAVRFSLRERPAWLTQCNCSFCRRAGGLWAHASPDAVEISYPPDGVVRYVWGDRTLAFVSCGACGCTTHWESLQARADAKMAVNLSMAEPEALEGLRVRRFDGADTWRFLD